MKLKTALQKLICFSVALALLIPALVSHADAAANKLPAYEAYYAFLTKEAENIGKNISDEDYYRMFGDDFFGKMNHSSKVEKILYAYLYDITGDGVEELFLKRKMSNSFNGFSLDSQSTEWICIYSYMDGKLVRIGQNEMWTYDAGTTAYGRSVGYYEPDGYIGTIISFEEYPSISDECIYICKGTDGKYTLADDELEIFMEHTFNLYRFDGAHLSTFKTFECLFHPNWRFGPIESRYGHMLFSLDGNQANRDVMESTLNQYTAGGVTKLVNNDYRDVLNTLVSAVEGGHKPSAWAAAEVETAKAKGYVPAALLDYYTEPITRAEFCQLATQYYESYRNETITAHSDFVETEDISVCKMAGLGVVNGVGEDKFNPNGTLTRQDAAVILIRLAKVMGYEAPKCGNAFADRAKIAGYAVDFVAQAADAGIMNGTGENNFAPQQDYTREQSILTILRMEKVMPR